MIASLKILAVLLTPFLLLLLTIRKKKGKEDAERLAERYGKPSLPCPHGHLVWVHAASVGEAQSALIVITSLLKEAPYINILITTGTRTSAALMAQRLPKKRCIHQFIPLDHPVWINRFLDHWQPDLALWMESELWPITLDSLKRRNIPALLVNARLSEKSYKRWRIVRPMAEKILSTFDHILCQTKEDAQRYKTLGAKTVLVTGNIKYSAEPLPVDPLALTALQKAIGTRPLWLYASTHEGEETLACTLHDRLKNDFPDLLTILVPRHPERRESLKPLNPAIVFRGVNKDRLPESDTQIYIADTLGELGLFYSLCPLSVIGRSFSKDGGGGHNPIEAAQLGSAVITGPNVQYQKALFEDMMAAHAAVQCKTEDDLYQTLHRFLSNPDFLQKARNAAKIYAGSKSHILKQTMTHIIPLIPKATEKDAA